MSLSLDDLWRSFPLDDDILAGVKQHLIQTQWLSEHEKWDSICGEEIDRNQFAVAGEGEDGSEVKSFAFFSHLFNAVLEYLRQRGHETSVKGMVYAGSTRSESTAGTSHPPDAFLQLNAGTSPTPGKFKWRDLVCPFEYKLSDGEPLNVSQPNLAAFPNRVLNLSRTTPRHCRASIASCAATHVEHSLSESRYMAPRFASGFCAEPHPSHSPLSTGSRLVQLHATGASVYNTSRTLNHSSNYFSYSQPPPRWTLVSIQTLKVLV